MKLMFKVSIPILLILSSIGCNKFIEKGELYNVRLKKIAAVSEAYAGFPLAMELDISADKEAKDVPYCLYLINKSDYDNEKESFRVLDLSLFKTIETVKKGVNRYEIKANVPVRSGHIGEYYLVGMMDPMGVIEGGGDEIREMDFLKDPDLFTTVTIRNDYVKKNDFYVDKVGLYTDVYTVRSSDKITDEVISGTVEVKCNGANPVFNVPVAVYLRGGGKMVSTKLWDNDLGAYVGQYVIAELRPEKPSVVTFSVSLTDETRHYIKESGTTDFTLDVILDPDNRFVEPSITRSTLGENNNLKRESISIVYDSGGETTRVSARGDTLVTPTGKVTVKDVGDASSTYARRRACSVSVGDYMYVIGGLDDDGHIKKNVIRKRFKQTDGDGKVTQDDASWTWEVFDDGITGTGNDPSYDHACVAVTDDKDTDDVSDDDYYIYVMGGYGDTGALDTGALDTVRRFKIDSSGTGSWADETKTLQEPLHGHRAVVQDNYIYVVGGAKKTQYGVIDDSTWNITKWAYGAWLNKVRRYPGLEIATVRNSGVRSKERARLVVMGGLNGIQSVGSVEYLELVRQDGATETDPSVFLPSEEAGTGLKYFHYYKLKKPTGDENRELTDVLPTPIHSFSTMNLYGKIYIMGGERRAYGSSRDASSDDSSFNGDVDNSFPETNELETSGESDILSLNAFTESGQIKTDMKYSKIGDEVKFHYHSMSALGYSSAKDGASAYVYGGNSSDISTKLLKVTVKYPEKETHFDLNGNPYFGAGDIIGAGARFEARSLFNTKGYDFTVDTGAYAQFFGKKLWAIRLEMRANHIVDINSDNRMMIKFTLLAIPMVNFGGTGKSVSISLGDIFDLVDSVGGDAEEMKRKEDGSIDFNKSQIAAAPGPDEEVTIAGKQFKQKKKWRMELAISFFAARIKDQFKDNKSGNVNPNKNNQHQSVSESNVDKKNVVKKYIWIGSTGAAILLEWDAGIKFTWDLKLTMEKGLSASGEGVDWFNSVSGNASIVYPSADKLTDNKETEYSGISDADYEYNRIVLQFTPYLSLYGHLAAGLSLGGILTIGIQADLDILALEPIVYVGKQFVKNGDETLYARAYTAGVIVNLYAIKGVITIFVEFTFPWICWKKWGWFRFPYICLKVMRKTLPAPKFEFCALKMTIFSWNWVSKEKTDWMVYETPEEGEKPDGWDYTFEVLEWFLPTPTGG